MMEGGTQTERTLDQVVSRVLETNLCSTPALLRTRSVCFGDERVVYGDAQLD